MKTEISSGGVVFRGRKILVIKDSYGRWALPKGLIEKGESSEEAALREIKEETGVDGRIVEPLGEIKYFYTLKKDGHAEGMPSGGERIFKIVKFFLIEAKNDEINISWEIQEAKWLPVEEAEASIEYRNTKEIMKKAIKIMKSNIKRYLG